MNRENVLNALVDMNGRCESLGVKPFGVQVFDDFALLETKPMPLDEGVDQEEFDGKIQGMVDDLSSAYNLRKNWLTTDASMIGKDFERVEFSVGKLDFVLNMDLSVITVMTLPDVDLLRLQLIALDCQIMNGEQSYGGRLQEIAQYGKRLGMGVDQMLQQFGEFLVEYDDISKILQSVM